MVEHDIQEVFEYMDGPNHVQGICQHYALVSLGQG